MYVCTYIYIYIHTCIYTYHCAPSTLRRAASSHECKAQDFNVSLKSHKHDLSRPRMAFQDCPLPERLLGLSYLSQTIRKLGVLYPGDARHAHCYWQEYMVPISSL